MAGKKQTSKSASEFGFLDSLDGLGGEADGNLEGLPGGEDDPYKGVKYKGKAEHDTKAELTEVQKKFREARKREGEQRDEIADAEFFVCLVFESKKQKAEFLEKAKIGLGSERYLDGLVAARRLGIKLTTPRVKFTIPRNDQSWADELGII